MKISYTLLSKGMTQKYSQSIIFFLFLLFQPACGNQTDPDEKLKGMVESLCQKSVQCFLKGAMEQVSLLPEKIKQQAKIGLPPHRRDLSACISKKYLQFSYGNKKLKKNPKYEDWLKACSRQFQQLECKEIIFMNEYPRACQNLLFSDKN